LEKKQILPQYSPFARPSIPFSGRQAVSKMNLPASGEAGSLPVSTPPAPTVLRFQYLVKHDVPQIADNN
jgi:hypothetical protein